MHQHARSPGAFFDVVPRPVGRADAGAAALPAQRRWAAAVPTPNCRWCRTSRRRWCRPFNGAAQVRCPCRDGGTCTVHTVRPAAAWEQPHARRAAASRGRGGGRSKPARRSCPAPRRPGCRAPPLQNHRASPLLFAPAAFRYSSKLAPRRLLTKPAEPASNSGWDNLNHDLIVAVGDEFVSTHGTRCARRVGRQR